jgi:hypothetical protein
MQPIQNENVSGAVVVLDGKYFMNCTFTDCMLVYCGGDYGWINTMFENCRFTFDGAAARTFNLCKNFGMLKGEPGDPLAQPPTSSKLENH